MKNLVEKDRNISYIYLFYSLAARFAKDLLTTKANRHLIDENSLGKSIKLIQGNINAQHPM